MAAEEGTAVCYSTHYLPEIEALDATVAIIERGEIIARGSVAQLVAQDGGGVLELVFAGPPPTVEIDRRCEISDNRLRIYTSHPTDDAAAVLSALGDAVTELRGMEIVVPSLESVFLTLTGRRFAAREEDRDVVPA